MESRNVSRRSFMGGLAAALGLAGTQPEELLAAHLGEAAQQATAGRTANAAAAVVKLSNNENPYGIAENIKQAMIEAFQYGHMYGTPDGGLNEGLLAYHPGMKRENVLLGSGSGEILQLAGTAFLISPGKKVVGVEPTYNDVYSQATSIKADSIRLPLLPDYTQDIDAMIQTVKRHYRDIGLVYVCNPNNPTGLIIHKNDIRKLLDELPEDVTVLIDEAYHHFVDDPNYESAIPYILEGRPVIVARTFSKIGGLAGMRLGYALGRPDLLAEMRRFQSGSLNVAVKFAGAAVLRDTAAQERVKRLNTDIRNKTTAELKRLGFDSIPSQGNFFMLHVKREVQGVIQDFRRKNVLVGRPFPPMTQHLRVSVGTAAEMDTFMTAFKEIFLDSKASGGGR